MQERQLQQGQLELPQPIQPEHRLPPVGLQRSDQPKRPGESAVPAVVPVASQPGRPSWPQRSSVIVWVLQACSALRPRPESPSAPVSDSVRERPSRPCRSPAPRPPTRSDSPFAPSTNDASVGWATLGADGADEALWAPRRYSAQLRYCPIGEDRARRERSAEPGSTPPAGRVRSKGAATGQPQWVVISIVI